MILLRDNLAARITAILLASVVALAVLAAIVMLWPRDYDTGAGGLFELPVPEETVAFVQALEASPPATRPLVLRALNTSAATVHIERDFPPVTPGLRRASELEWMFARYSSLLGGRPFRVEMRGGLLPKFLIDGSSASMPAVRLSVRLRDGSVMVVERRPSGLIRSYIARIAAIAGAAALILIAGLMLAIRQTARPVARLALAAQHFSLDGAVPDLPLAGPRELRDLSVAFNEMQQRIRSLVGERTRILAAIAHDLRTYLTRLRLRSEFIADADQRDRAIRDIEDMSLLLDDTLLFAQQTAKAAPPAQPIDIFAEVEAFVVLRRELGEPVALACARKDAGDARLACNALGLRRMLANLVDNAIRYGGAARIAIAVSPSTVTLAVSDDGPGIPPEDMVRLTEPFERLEVSRARETGGAGLGLAIVKALAESSGATLLLENRQPHGLTASLRFPRA